MGIRVILAVAALTLLLAAAYTGSASEMGQFETELLGYINQFRTNYNMSSLKSSPRLDRLAWEHSENMRRLNEMNHQGFSSRFERSGSHSCVENVGWNAQSPFQQFQGWRDSEGHKQNMLSRNMRYAGIARSGAYVTFLACE